MLSSCLQAQKQQELSQVCQNGVKISLTEGPHLELTACGRAVECLDPCRAMEQKWSSQCVKISQSVLCFQLPKDFPGTLSPSGLGFWGLGWPLPKKPTLRKLLHRKKEVEQVVKYVENPFD